MNKSKQVTTSSFYQKMGIVILIIPWSIIDEAQSDDSQGLEANPMDINL